MKKTHIIVTVLALIIIAFLLIKSRRAPAPEAAPIVAVFTDSASQQSVTVSFDNTAQTATLDGAGYEGLIFHQDISASGARYVEATSGLELWNKGDDITLYDSTGKPLFSGTNVAALAPSAPAAGVGSLSGATWVWQKTQPVGGETVTPREAGAFTLTFSADGRASGTTDCNGFSGTFTAGEGQSLAFGALASTKMFCMNSQEEVFTKALSSATSYTFSPSGDLILALPGTAGAMTFAKR